MTIKLENDEMKMNESKKQNPGYQTLPFSINRHMMAATLDIARKQNNIQALMEVDITEPRRLIYQHQQKTGERYSLTAYVVTCLGRAIAQHPQLNAFRKGRKLIVLDDVTIGVMVERELGDEKMPENVGVQIAQKKSLREIHTEIRSAQERKDDSLGSLSGMSWIRYIPAFLMRTFVGTASRNISIMKRYGAVGVTAVGLFYGKKEALWMLPLVGGATVAVAIGGIVERPVVCNGKLETHEHLCLTVTFNHEIVDGAPAARFLKTYSEILKSGDLLRVVESDE